MRRMFALVISFVLVLAMAVSVSAATGVTSQQSFASVSADGSCQVNIAMTLRLDAAVDKLYFPVPAKASSVRVNGSRVSASKDGDVRNINLSRITGQMAGEFSLNIQYTLRDVIHRNEDGILQLEVPVLCGFAYPVENLFLSVTLPGEVPVLPSFSSGYHQAAIEEYLNTSAEGAVVTARSLKAMKDRETLVMTMAVSEDMFPQSIVKEQSTDTAYAGMIICGVLGLLYWFIALRSLPWRRKMTAQPPQGYTAGQMGGLTYMQGVDLTMSVFTWASLGYIQIIRDRGGHIILKKRMEMGNERSEAELRCFGKLFGTKDTVDTRSYRYAALQQAVEKRPTMVQELLRKRTGNTLVLRIFATGVGLCAGGGIGLSMGSGAVLQVLLVGLLGILGGFSAWFMVPWAAGAFLRRKDKFYRGLALAVIWLLLGLIAGEFTLALWFVGGMALAGILNIWAGRRTVLGRQTTSQALGLKRYLRHPNKEQLRQQMEENANYFFDMIPYAMALGADKGFARSFGARKLERCPYLSGVDGERSAMDWLLVLQDVAASMDRRAQQLPAEKAMAMIRSFTRR